MAPDPTDSRSLVSHDLAVESPERIIQVAGFTINVPTVGGDDRVHQGWPADVRELALNFFKQVPNTYITAQALWIAGVRPEISERLILSWVTKAGLLKLRREWKSLLSQHLEGSGAELADRGIRAQVAKDSQHYAFAADKYFERAERFGLAGSSGALPGWGDTDSGIDLLPDEDGVYRQPANE